MLINIFNCTAEQILLLRGLNLLNSMSQIFFQVTVFMTLLPILLMTKVHTENVV